MHLGSGCTDTLQYGDSPYAVYTQVEGRYIVSTTIITYGWVLYHVNTTLFSHTRTFIKPLCPFRLRKYKDGINITYNRQFVYCVKALIFVVSLPVTVLLAFINYNTYNYYGDSSNRVYLKFYTLQYHQSYRPKIHPCV